MNLGTLLLCLCLSSTEPPRDRWISEDKLKHFFASFAVTSIAASGARAAGASVDQSVWVGAGTGASLGVWKELRDHGRSGETASLRDLVWDFAGVGAASAVLLQTR